MQLDDYQERIARDFRGGAKISALIAKFALPKHEIVNAIIVAEDIEKAKEPDYALLDFITDRFFGSKLNREQVKNAVQDYKNLH